MINKYFLKIYRFIFSRKLFFKINYHFFRLNMRGLGLLNSEGERITGEEYFIKWISKNINLKIIMDIGANTGNYSILINKYSPSAIIFAYEPHPDTFNLLKSNTNNISNINIYNLGLDKKRGKSELWDFANDSNLKHSQPTSTLASQYKEVVEGFHKQKSMKYTIYTTSINHEFNKHNLRKIDLIQIDTEGSEFKILNSAKNLLQKNKIRVVQFEFNEMNVYSRVFMKDYFDLFDNYKLFRLLPNELLPLGDYKPDVHELFAFQNIIAINKNEKELLKKI